MNKFQIIVPTKNSKKNIYTLITSLQKQTYKNWEVIFIDKSSNQKDIHLLKKICLEDNRFKYIKQNNKNKKIFGAMNQGLENTDKNTWILFWGSDDWAAEFNTLEKLNIKIKNLSYLNLDLIICKGKYYNFDKSFCKNCYFTNNIINKKISINKYKNLLFRGLTPPHQSTIMNSRIFSSFYKYDDEFLLAGDLDFFCKLTNKKFLSIYLLNSYIVSISCGGISSKNHLKRLIEVKKSYNKVFGKLYLIPFLLRYFLKVFNYS